MHTHANSNKTCRGAAHDHLRLAGKLTWGSVKNPQSPTRALNRRLTAQENGQGHFCADAHQQKRAHCKLLGTETMAKQCERASRDAAQPRCAAKLEMKVLQKWRSTARTRIQKSKVAAKKGALIDTAHAQIIFADAPWPAKPVDAQTEVPSQALLSDRPMRSAPSQC